MTGISVHFAVIVTPQRTPSVAVWEWEDYVKTANTNIIYRLSDHFISSSQMMIDGRLIVRASLSSTPGGHNLASENRARVVPVVVRITLEGVEERERAVIMTSRGPKPSFDRLQVPKDVKNHTSDLEALIPING